MNRKKGLSLLSIGFLLFQLLMPGIGFAVEKFSPTETTQSENVNQVAVKEKEQDNDSVTWKIWLNEAGSENEEMTTKVKLGSGLTKGKVIKNDEAEIEETESGYSIVTPEGSRAYEIEIKTSISDKEKSELSIEAIASISGQKFKASDKALNEGKIKRDEAEAERIAKEKAEAEAKKAKEEAEAKKAKEEAEAKKAKDEAEAERKAQEEAEAERKAKEEAEAKKAKDEAEAEKGAANEAEDEKLKKEKAQKDKEDKSTKKKTEDKTDKNKDKKAKAIDEDEKHYPIEQERSTYSSKVKSFSGEKRLLSTVEDAVATHEVNPIESDNMCLREVEGTIDINLPVPSEKKPVDIVIVQDASGSYKGNEDQVKQSLNDIVDRLDLTQDRMMVTSYRGYKGYKSYSNLANYNSGTVYGTSTSTYGVRTIKHAGLTNNKTALENGIQSIVFDNATPTASGLKFAKDQYNAEPAVPGENPGDRETIFVLITDGVANAQLDGFVHTNRQYPSGSGPQYHEKNQFYQQTFAEVEGVANDIKNQGYQMVSAYWENKSVLRTAYGTNYYNNTIGPAARQMVQNIASSPDNYSSNEDLAATISALLANLDIVLNEYNGFKTEFDIAPGFELVPDSLKINGSAATYTQTGDSENGTNVVVTKNKIKSGESTLTYKLRETKVHGNQTTPVTNGLVSYDKASDGTFKETLDIPNANLIGNPNSDKCEVQVTKEVAKGDSGNFTDGTIQLDEFDDLFTYKLEYQFDEKVASFSSVQLKDELESVLEFVGTANDITVDSVGISNLNETINLLNNKSGFTIDIPKKNDSYNYLAGNKITVTFKAKIRDGIKAADLVNYPDQKIPNQGVLLLDEEVTKSNIVYVQAPERGKIKITKVDADNAEIKLEGAKFDIYDSNNDKVGELVTNEFGVDTSEELPIGDYTLIEVEAPAGYVIDTNDLTVSVIAGGETQKTIKNNKLKGTIKIIKVDSDNVETKLPGAKFDVLDSDGVSVGILETGADGTVISDELPAGNYTLVEIKAPTGYEIDSTNLSLKVEGGKQTVKTIKNSKLKGKVSITKVGSDKKALKGAIFELKDASGNSAGIKTSNENGKIIFDNLEWGDYTLTETKAPEGYRLLEKEISITIDKENLNIEKTIINSKQDWQIPETGGIGSLGFYGLGLLFMAIAAWFIFRKRRTE